jgi:hypothetical protein
LQVFYYFGVDDNVRTMSADSAWRRLRGTGPGRTLEPEDGGFFSSKEYARLEEEVPAFLRTRMLNRDGTPALSEQQLKEHLLSNRNNSHYELALDWFQPWSFKKYSLGALLLR